MFATPILVSTVVGIGLILVLFPGSLYSVDPEFSPVFLTSKHLVFPQPAEAEERPQPW
jgi:hypothetical protein